MAAYLLHVVLLFVCGSNAIKPGPDITDTHCQNDTYEFSIDEQADCPTWFVKRAVNGITTCQCGHTSNDVKCNDDKKQVFLSVWTCMTYDEPHNATLLGNCPFNYHYPNIQHLYITLPNDTSQLNSFMCGDLNRTGLLCGQCQQALGAAVLSYRRQCVECLDAWYGWLVYITAALLPSTLFCFLVIVFNFHTTTANMNAFVFLCQFITSMSTILTNQNSVLDYSSASKPLYFMSLGVLTFYGFWNLDFFRYFIPPFCVSSDMNTLHTLALEYVVAIYPLFLMVVIYLCIEMYDKGVRVVVCMWRPFHRCFGFGCFKGRWNPRGSVIGGFATFLLLSYSKLLTVSYSLLEFSRLSNDRGDRVGTVLTYDASIEYFSRQHLPFAILAIIVMLVFVALPLLILLLYPMKLFQRSLGHCTRIRWHPLHTFADAFQGCYKNGTNGTRDYRYFAGFYLLFRIVYLLRFVLQYHPSLIFEPMPVIASLLFALLRPYTTNIFNIVDCLVFAILALINFWVRSTLNISAVPIHTVAYITGIIPLFYFIFFILYKFLSEARLFRTCCGRIKEIFHTEVITSTCTLRKLTALTIFQIGL